MKAALFVLLTGTLVLATGCVSTAGRTVYTRAHSGQSYRVEFGTVIGVRNVVIDGTADTNIGLYGGGAMGGATASGIGTGTGGAIATAAGAVGGMIVGREIEKAVTRKEGLEIHIELDNGDQIMVVQDADKGGFMDGDRVRVMIGQGTTVVMH
jgi:outer membrane lipoprotein SlyB